MTIEIDGCTLEYEFETDKKHIAITNGRNVKGNFTIPSRIDGFPVTRIGDEAFSDCSGLTSVTIPDSVKSIEAGAFSRCSGLTSVALPAGVKSIGEGAFRGCCELTSVSMPKRFEGKLDEYVFDGCPENMVITYRD